MFLPLLEPIVWLALFTTTVISSVGGAWWQNRNLVKANQQKMQRIARQQATQQVNMAAVAVVLAVVVALFQLPTLSIDINGIFTYAFDVVNAFMPLIAIVAGLGLGFNLITKISRLFTQAF